MSIQILFPDFFSPNVWCSHEKVCLFWENDTNHLSTLEKRVDDEKWSA